MTKSNKLYLGVISGTFLTKCDKKQFQFGVPQGHSGSIINFVTSSEELKLHITDLNDICLIPNAQHLLTGLLRRRPQRQPQVRIIREQTSCLLGHLHGLQMCRSAWLHDQTYGSIMKYFSLTNRNNQTINPVSNFYHGYNFCPTKYMYDYSIEKSIL